MTLTAGPPAAELPPAELPAAELPDPPRRPRVTRRLIALAIVAVVIVAGAITAVKIAFRYAHAAPLSCACGLAWGAAEHNRGVRVGGEDSLVATARPGHAQTFYVLITNRTPVTQTILGPESHDRETAEPIEFAVAVPTGSLMGDQADYLAQRYTTQPVALVPDGIRWVRYTIHTAAHGLWSHGRSEFWTDLYLRVRVGAFTRTERVPLLTQMVLEAR